MYILENILDKPILKLTRHKLMSKSKIESIIIWIQIIRIQRIVGFSIISSYSITSYLEDASKRTDFTNK